MSIETLLVLLGIGVACSIVGQTLAGYSIGGFFVGTAVGLLGALLGVWIARTFDMPTLFEITAGGFTFPLAWAILGSATLVAALAALGGGKRW
jgi:uncharacterized membrane protein YeaQ/YmgE (transglycosylase-associated protein family)